ncbi:hypothetical protein C7451_107193 [Blastomonas natatoria]|uniref:Uncharacterized protein n=1 Tax=Blastomonas natatoria TaxID=34015 RepID=A0A2V3V0F7_9SPHN|nr:hypothetical protein [Blastomonas natatoria]PXW75222.1 hypothetical protein C7451_107193 [Blastomonas natatoria]
MTADERRARSRFFVIGAVRLAGAITIALAVAISFGRIAGLPGELGYVLLALGIVEFLLLPQMLVKRWKTPTSE